jgi:ABC-type lipoprotein export system ATPase subunit
MPADELILALHDVRKDYHGLRPLRLQHLELHQGESVALVGFDRVGAEVLSNLIMGGALPDAGDIHVFGTLTQSITNVDDWLGAMHRFGILSERIVLLESFSVEQNLALPFSLEIEPVPDHIRSQTCALADEVGLDSRLLSQAAGRLEPEALQRTRLAKALALNPRLLLAEHPNASLSADAAARLARDLSTIAKRRHLAMVVMTADVRFARAAADRALTVRAATGELTPIGGWRGWFTRR